MKQRYQLHAAIYDDDYQPTTNNLLAALGPVADCNISWEIPGGVRDFAFTVKARTPLEAYSWYRRYPLQRAVLYDNYLDQPIASGDVTYIGYRHGQLVVGARGPWWRLYDGLENTAASSGENTDDVIMRAITDHDVSQAVSNTDYTHIAGTSAAVTETLPTGTTTSASAGKLVDGGATFVTSNVRVGDIARDTTGATFTTVTAIDSETQLSVADDVFASSDGYTILRPFARGTTTSTVANKLIDSKADFSKSRVLDSMRAFNMTDTTTQSIATVDGATQLTLDGDVFTKDEQYIVASNLVFWSPPYEGIPVADVIREMCSYGDGTGAQVYFWLRDWPFYSGIHPRRTRAYLAAYSATATADWQVWTRDLDRRPEIGRDFANLFTSISILEPNGNANTAQTANTSTYWTRSAVRAGYGAIPGLATERALTEVNQLSDGALRRPIVVTARTIKDGAGFSWPLWRVIAHGGGYLRINDAFPDAALASGAGYDRERQGRIITMDYSYRRNALRVTLDDDTRADRRFRDLGFDESLLRRLRQVER